MADTNKPEPKKKTAPYLPFKTFMNSLDTFSQGVPSTLDRTIWKSQAGLMQGLIMNTYRFFGLVDEYDGPNEVLYDMVSKPEQRPAILRGLIEATYGHEFGNDFTSMTPKVLEDCFVDCYAVTGATKQKAITFFLKAARFATVPLSPFLMSQIRNTSTRKRKIRAKEPSATVRDSGPPLNNNNNPAATTHSVSLNSGGTLTVLITANPFKMPQKDREFVFSLIDKLQEYEAENASEEEVEEEEV